jgi:pyridoxal phosphate enzyme (YggS family)
MTEQALAGRIAAVQDQIAAAAARAGRSADALTLVAVSKQMPAATIEAAWHAGLRHFGENRSAELAEKGLHLAHLPDLHWHMIGPLQSRQTAPIVAHAAAFHALERLRIAQRLSRQLEEAGRTLPVFIEVNVSGEASKSGFSADLWEQESQQRDALLETCTAIAALPCLAVQGLMTMAPWDVPESTIRATFRRTRELAAWLGERIKIGRWDQLSMGMTDDFPLAIAEGATHLRIGRAIFQP